MVLIKNPNGKLYNPVTAGKRIPVQKTDTTTRYGIEDPQSGGGSS
jgi:hypothetical protein